MTLKSLFLAAAVLLSGSVSLAQRAPGIPDRGDRSDVLERRVNELERALERTDARLRRVERLLDGGTVQPPSRVDVSCLIVDRGYKKTFLASGRNALEAEANVRNACGNGAHPSYCDTEVKCSSGQSENVRGYMCVVTDRGYKKTFKAEGKNIIEAEAKAKQACENGAHPSYCGGETARCEAF